MQPKLLFGDSMGKVLLCAAEPLAPTSNISILESEAAILGMQPASSHGFSPLLLEAEYTSFLQDPSAYPHFQEFLFLLFFNNIRSQCSILLVSYQS